MSEAGYFAAAAVLVIPAAILLWRTFRRAARDPFARLMSGPAVAAAALLLVALGLVSTPFLLAEQGRRCAREELVNVFVGRVSQARTICVDYGDGSTDAVRSPFLGIRFSPPDVDRERPFTIVIFGLEPGEQVHLAVAPIGIGLQPATVTADRAGEARLDFRIPQGASPEWLVLARRANGESVAAAVPLPPAGSDPLGRVTPPPFAPPTPDPSTTTSTCTPSRVSAGTAVRCTFVGLTGEYATFSRTDLGTGETVHLRSVDVVRPGGRTVYEHTYRVTPGEWLITALTPTGATASARFTVIAE